MYSLFLIKTYIGEKILFDNKILKILIYFTISKILYFVIIY